MSTPSGTKMDNNIFSFMGTNSVTINALLCICEINLFLMVTNISS